MLVRGNVRGNGVIWNHGTVPDTFFRLLFIVVGTVVLFCPVPEEKFGWS